MCSGCICENCRNLAKKSVYTRVDVVVKSFNTWYIGRVSNVLEFLDK